MEDREITDCLSDHGSGLHADRSTKKERRTRTTAGAQCWHLYVVFVSETMAKTMVRSGCLRLLAAGLAAAVPDMNETNRTLQLAYVSFCDEADLKSWTCMWCAGSGATVELIQFLSTTSAGTPQG